MGLFSSLRSGIAGRNPNDDTARSVLALPLLIASYDGKIDDSETHQIPNMCACSPIFHAVGAQRTVDLGKALERGKAHSDGDGRTVGRVRCDGRQDFRGHPDAAAPRRLT